MRASQREESSLRIPTLSFLRGGNPTLQSPNRARVSAVMLTLARAHRVVSSRLALQSLATRCKTTTGIVGLPVDEDARTTLGEHYAKVLEAITVIPESAVYRQSVEKTVKHRLAALQTGAEDEELEQQFGRQLEEEIKIMKDELKLIPKMAGEAGLVDELLQTGRLGGWSNCA